MATFRLTLYDVDYYDPKSGNKTSDLCVWELMNNPGTGSEMMGGF